MTMLLAICGWTLWCFVALLSMGMILNSDRDGGVRFLMRTNGVVLAVGLAATALLPVSRFHLLWFVPVSPVIPMFVMSYRMNRALSRALVAGDLAGKPIETQREKVLETVDT
jgi:hypothetical protein